MTQKILTSGSAVSIRMSFQFLFVFVAITVDFIVRHRRARDVATQRG